MTDTKFVYSTEPGKMERCPRCREFVRNCRCAPEQPVPSRMPTAVLRIEKAGRGGKTVTVIDGLPGNEAFLTGLAKKLKERCGCGGTWRKNNAAGCIELQGERREQLRSLLEKEGIKTKG